MARATRYAPGADSIEHATGMDEATIAEMARRKTFYVPTIDHNRYYVDNYRKLNYPPSAVDDCRLHCTQPGDRAAGVPRRGALRHGSERGVHDVWRKHARAGMVRQSWNDAGTGAARRHAPTERNCSAWRNRWARSGPASLPISRRLRGDPLADIDVVIQKVRWVMKGGAVVVDRTK
mgnify:CR=1 FL=1